MGASSSVLVLGGSGFLGSWLCELALDSGLGVHSASRCPQDGPGGEETGCGRVEFDAMRTGAGAALIEHLRPERIVICTALSRAGECERDRERALRINRDFPAEVAVAAAARGTRLVHVSTDQVFGARAPLGERYAEEDAPAALNTYGRTKAEGERRVLSAYPVALIVRLPLLFGDSRGRALGASDALLAAVDRGERPTLFVDEWRTPLDVAEAAAALLELVQGEERGILHVGGPERVTRLQLGQMVLAAGGRPPDAVDAGRRADLGLSELRARDVSLDSSRAIGLLDASLNSPGRALGESA